MGFPQSLPGTDVQYSAMQVGEHLKLIYEKFLEDFERDSIQKLMDELYRQRVPASQAPRLAQSLNTNTSLDVNRLANSNTLVSQVLPYAPAIFASMTLQTCHRLANLSNLPDNDLAKRLPSASAAELIKQRPFLRNLV